MFSVVGTSRCDVRAACSGATPSNGSGARRFVPPANARAGTAQRAIPTIMLNTYRCPKVPDHFGGPAFERSGRTRREAREGKPDHSSFARREEKKWDAEDSVPPGPNVVRVARNEPCVRGAQNNNPNGDAPRCAPVAGRDVVPNVPDLFGGLALECLGRTRREGRERKPDHSSFARREEEKWDAEDSVPPGDGSGDF